MAFGEISQLIQGTLLPNINTMLEAKLATFGSIMDRIGFPVLMVLIAVLYVFKNRKNAIERGHKPGKYIAAGLVLTVVMGLLGWVFTIPLAAAVLTLYGGMLSTTISDNFRPEKHSASATAMALTNIITGLFTLILWGIWLFDSSKNMTWFLLVFGAPILVYGYSAFGLLTASTGSNDKKILTKNHFSFAISCAAIGAAILYIGTNGLIFI